MERASIIHGAKLQEELRRSIQAAIAEQELEASEMLEFYLVSLLRDFQHRGWLFDGIDAHNGDIPLAILLMEAMNKEPRERHRSLRKVGDQALIISGFFGDSVRRGTLDLSYYISIGGSAYLTLADLMEGHAAFATLYAEMGEHFADLVDVLAQIAPWNRPETNAELLQLYKRWLTTGDENLKVQLERRGIFTDDIPGIPEDA